jgi:Na+/proline symporter
MLDATLIVLQFAFFLVLGLCLFAFYNGAPLERLGVKSSDEIFPKFIVEELPSGLAGLMIAGIFASAMGTLSSSISALASSSFLDILRGSSRGKELDAASELRWSRALTVFWGLVLIGGAMLFRDTSHPVVEIGLRIASFTYGGLLGTFFLGLLFPRVTTADAFAGFIASLVAMGVVMCFTRIDYTWHTLIGCLAALGVGNLRAVATRLRT